MEEPSWTAPPGMTQPMGIQSTAGAVPIMNDKGEVSMKKVKVQRYVSGKRPEYAPASSDEEVSDDEDFTKPRSAGGAPMLQSTKTLTQAELSDPRLRRLMANRQDLPESDEEEEDLTSRRPVHQAEVVEMSDHEDEEVPEAPMEVETEKAVPEEEQEQQEQEQEQEPEQEQEESEQQEKAVEKEEEEEEEEEKMEREEEEDEEEEEEEEEDDEEEEMEKEQPVEVRYVREGEHHRLVDSDSESEDEVDEEQLEQRRLRLRELAMKKAQQEEELLGKEDEGSEESSEEESSEYDEEETDSEEEGPRLKPVFVRRKDRVTLHQKEQQEAKVKQTEVDNRRRVEERRRETLRMIERENREANNLVDKHDPIESVNTDDEGDEAEYEAWKLRELRRLKRDKEEREAAEKEREEVERLRNLTEEERRIELRNNPKLVTNKAQKGKYKFLQKYYHRGAFYMDQEEDIFRRDFSGATLEDHFDKTILPKVMQVKNFGRSGRTKYTHLVDQDTTSFDSPWAADSQMNHKFFNGNAGGMKQNFEKPTSKKRQVAGVQNNVPRK